MIYQLTRRLTDVVVAGFLLMLTAPLMAVVAIVIRFRLGSPVLFRQQRPGLHGKPFEILKFRTLTDGRDSGGALLPDAQRVTRLGSVLRSTSIDELPELLNVLRGEMTLVGPRPLMMAYLDRYSPEQARRHDVKPGITGLAQVKGRNALSWEQKLAYDIEYVDHRSLRLDAKILAATVQQVFKTGETSAPGEVGASEFLGSAQEPETSNTHALHNHITAER